MAHTHPVVDSDSRFVINSTTREISTTSDKLELIQGDHQSERITFEIPKIVEGHDMSLSDRIEVHYINIDRRTNATSRDVYIIDDASVDGDKLTFSWLISGNATKYYGRLNFIILFECLDPDGNYTYKWNTEICKLLTIGEGISNTSAVIEDHSDILEKFKKEILEEAGENSIQPDWNQNDSTAADYVKNRPFYSQHEEGYFIENKSVSIKSASRPVYVRGDVAYLPFSVGETYKVTWDGVEYSCMADSVYEQVYIGNAKLAGAGGSSDEPFLIVYSNGDYAVGGAVGEHNFSISGVIDRIIKLPSKFLPPAEDYIPSSYAKTMEIFFGAQIEQLIEAEQHFKANGVLYLANRLVLDMTGSLSTTSKVTFYTQRAAYTFKSDGTNTTSYTLENSVLHNSDGSPNGIILNSKDSSKQFLITVDDTGTISATEVT